MRDAILQAAGQAWPPFVLVTGLLLIGAVVEADGLFEALGTRIERIGGGPVVLLSTLLALDAVVTAILNLDTAAVFVTPIVIHAARQRRCDERPFLYGALFIANGASLLLPGSNLTNLIVLAHSPRSGAAFAEAMVLPWVVVIALTIAFMALVYRPTGAGGATEPLAPLRIGLGALVTLAATVLILALRNPALPVLAVGLGGVARRRLRPKLSLPVLTSLFLLAVSLGTLARRWSGPASLVAHAGGVGAAALGAVSSVAINNLPAATLLSARPPAHPLPLLIGLNLGPNLAVTGSLSAYLWYRAARRVDAHPSIRQVSLLGLGLVPVTIAAALAALSVADPGAF
ncbi:MAG TPA: SLC13 family permease [Gaiellaceae bacterium]|nr:SLC13 family permease [Gaiellaceae bacterium]